MSIYQDVIIAGFGGQGVLLIGNLLAYAAMSQGLKVTYMPVYGVEMRGGTANCTVVISDEDIGSPLILHPRSLIAMNLPSLLKFQPRVVKNGLQIVNSSLVEENQVETKQLQSYLVPVNNLADQLGNSKMANMIALGAWCEATGIIELDSVKQNLKKVVNLTPQLLEKNKEAIEMGAQRVQASQT